MASEGTTSSQICVNPRRIVISEQEFLSGVTNLENIQVGVEEFQTHGFAILENAIPFNAVDKIRKQMLADSATCLTFPDLVYNHGVERTNFSITPPLSDDFLFEEVWANKHATNIMQQIIGPKPLLCWASSNVAIPSLGHARQAVHSDAYTDIPKFPFCVEMNIYLQDTTPENGTTEIWPGTHVFTEDDHIPHGRGWIKKAAFTNRARTSPPIYPAIPAGSIMMRDLRLWHSGMPNTSQEPRIIVAFLYFPQWFRPQMRMTLPASVRPKVKSWKHIDLLSNTEFAPYPIDHLRTRFPMNFTQDPVKELISYRISVDIRQGRPPNAAFLVTKDNFWTSVKQKGPWANEPEDALDQLKKIINERKNIDARLKDNAIKLQENIAQWKRINTKQEKTRVKSMEVRAMLKKIRVMSEVVGARSEDIMVMSEKNGAMLDEIEAILERII